MKRYAKRKVFRGRLRRTKKARVPRVRTVKSIVHRAIARATETKIASTSMGLTSFNSAISAAGDLVAPLPSIGFGTGQANRVGHTIKPIKFVIRGAIVYNINQIAQVRARMIGCRLFLLQDKANKSYNNSLANYNLLNSGGNSYSYTGDIAHFNDPTNKDQFVFFKDKRYRMFKGYGNTSTDTNPMDSISPSMYRPFTLVLTKKHLPAFLKYDTTDGVNFPVNFAPYLALGYSDLLGGAADTTATQISMYFTSTLYYKDA